MKKLVSAILLLALLCGALAGCKDYSRKIDFFEADFSWDMNPDEAMEYILSHQVMEAEIEREDYDTWTTITDGYYIFRFDAKGKMEFVKIDMGYDGGMLAILEDWYGQWDEYGERFSSYAWYGNMAGENIKMTFYRPSSTWYLEFTME